MTCPTSPRSSALPSRRSAALALGLALVMPTLACDAYEPEPQPEPEPAALEARVLVGTVEGTDLVLGALLDGDTVAIYQCGGDTTFASHTRWFRGLVGFGDEADPDEFELVEGDMTLVGLRTTDGLEGELVEPDGSRHPFVLDPVGDDDEPGVYVAVHDGLTTGIVVRRDGDSTVAQGASCDAQDECSQVIILPPLDLTTRSFPVQVEVDGSLVDVEVSRTLVAP